MEDFIFSSRVKITSGDALDEYAIWPHNIDICITRVPIRKRDGYDASMLKRLTSKIYESMANGGIVFLICYAPTEDKARPFEVARAMQDQGFNHIDNIIVERSWLPGKRSESNLVNSHDYVLFFCKGKVWGVDRLPIKEYLKLDEEISCPGNTWKVETGSLDEAYPIDLAKLLVRLADSLPGSTVFDPFMGTQSGVLAAVECGHSFIGYESDNRRLKRYKKILNKMYDEGKI